jgi:hypothetical protein
MAWADGAAEKHRIGGHSAITAAREPESMRSPVPMRAAISATVAMAICLLGAVGHDVRAEDPSAIPRPSALPDLPAPPPWFDPATIAYVGSASGSPGSGTDLWTGRLGDPDITPVLVAGHAEGRLVAGQRLLVSVPGRTDFTRDLVLVESDGTARTVASDVSTEADWLVDAAGDSVYAVRRRGGGREISGLWRFELAGGDPVRVMPPSATGSVNVISPDERSFASGDTPGDTLRPIAVRFDLGRIEQPVRGVPLGFDASGRLLFSEGRYDPRTGRTERIRQLGPGTDRLLTRDGHTWLAVVDGEVRALDLVDGSFAAWALPGDGDWELTPLGDDRRVVLGRYVTTEGGRILDVYAVVDLWDGWIGFVPNVLTGGIGD